MKKERENKSSIKLSATDGIPKVSFGASGMTGLTREEYDIAGNEFAAFYDDAHKLIFVLDRTLDNRKPNVLLVINQIDDRKWDDILANDYGMDLETIRPKVDNKYQKLDIEYSGLTIYNKLINEYNSNGDIAPALAELSNYRTATVRRAETERLVAATETITKSRETISKTGETMRELQARLKKLREKLARQKKEVGKEPTKQSAAKILKTESQIDATNDKLKRAKKRLKNAQRRVEVANEDIKIARNILGQREQIVDVPAPVIKEEVIIKEEPKAIDMADTEEVKPLFDKDPEILDEKIAFKPIDFSAPASVPSEKLVADSVIDEEKPAVFEPVPIAPSFEPVSDVPPAPLSFTPPTATAPVTEPVFEPTPVVEPEPTFTPEPVIEPAPVIESAPAPVAEPIAPVTPVAEPVRPVSPITGVATPVEPVASSARARPTMLYYVMLVILIVLSIFTLWMYQKNSGDTVPELVASSQQQVILEEKATAPTEPSVPEIVESPFIQVASEPVVVQPEPIVEPVVQPEPVVVPEPEPAVIIDSAEYETEVPVMPEPTSPVLVEPSVPEPVYTASAGYAETIAPVPTEQIVNKQPYDVSSDKAFMADQNYNAPAPVYTTEQQYYESQTSVVCDDGLAPNSYGCCTGEVYTDMGRDGFMCCLGTECFPPLN